MNSERLRLYCCKFANFDGVQLPSIKSGQNGMIRGQSFCINYMNQLNQRKTSNAGIDKTNQRIL